MRTTEFSPLRLFMGLLVVALLALGVLTGPSRAATLSTDLLHLLDSRPNIELGFGLASRVEWFVGVHSLEVLNTQAEKETGLDINTGLGLYWNGVYDNGFYTRFNGFVARVQEDSKASRTYKGPIYWSLGYSWQFGNNLRLKLGIVPGFFNHGGDFYRTFMRDNSADGVDDDADHSDFEVRIGYKL